MRVSVSATSLMMPARCACCAEASETVLPVVATRNAEGRPSRRSWSIPYCQRCAAHVERAPIVPWPQALLLTLLTCGFFLISWINQLRWARATRDGRCANPKSPVVYVGWKGTEHHFDFASPAFTFSFLDANRQKLTNLSDKARALLERPPQLPALAPRPQEIIPPQPPPSVHRPVAARSSSSPPSVPVVPSAPVVVKTSMAASVRPAATAAVPPSIARPGAPSAPASVRFYAHESVDVAGRHLGHPLTYVGAGDAPHASAILTQLPVGNANGATPLPYWPSYSSATPDQRARYLDWMAAGRQDASVDIGCVFLFFYGLERRLLIDRQDEALARQEVDRLFGIYAGQSASFRTFATELLTFSSMSRGTTLDEAAVEDQLGSLATDSPAALAATLAWYHQNRRPLPVRHAIVVMMSTNEAKQGVVVQRSARELQDLFALRYRERYGEGVLLEALARPTVVDYQPASAALLRTGDRISLRLADVLGSRIQWNALVSIWNACVDDLKRASTVKKKAGGELSVEAWTALPPDLRAQYDHPDQERWNLLLSEATPAGRFSVTTLGEIAEAAHVLADRLTPGQLRKLGETATQLGVAVEPELRLARTAQVADTPLVLWRCKDVPLPDADTYSAAASVLALATSIAQSDGASMDDDELRVVTRIIEDLFHLDDGLRIRLAAHLEWLQLRPANAIALARKLQASLKPEQLRKLGRLLVAVAAADGTVSRAEHAALDRLYKTLGLPAADLAAALIASEARLENDDTVAMQPATTGATCEAIPAPPGDAPRLNQRAIEAILADTRDVAAMLSAVLGTGIDEPVPEPAASVAPDGLDARYQGVLAELLAKPVWHLDEVRQLSLKAKLMPGAILETINGWSDASYGEYLIDDRGDWHIRAELLRRSTP